MYGNPDRRGRKPQALGLLALIAAAMLASCGPRVEVPHNPDDARLLGEVLKPAGLAEAKLRDIGIGADLDYPANKLAVAWYEGRVAELSLRGAKLEAVPDLGQWKDLETLVLADNRLEALPDLSKNIALRHLDISGNRIASLDPAHLPPGLVTLNISGNPIADLGPLAKLSKLEELKARNTQVADLTPLLGLKLTTADLRGCKIAKLPAQLPKNDDLVVDLAGCPVMKMAGVMDEWSFRYSQGSTPGGSISTREGVVTPGNFVAKGTWQSVAGMSSVAMQALHPGTAGGPINLEVGVATGTLRVYLLGDKDPRGPWFESGNVKGHGGFAHTMVMTYADATPGHPARMFGHVESMGSGPFTFTIQPLGQVPVTGMTYRAWR